MMIYWLDSEPKCFLTLSIFLSLSLTDIDATLLTSSEGYPKFYEDLKQMHGTLYREMKPHRKF